jgi:sugar-phosphatase
VLIDLDGTLMDSAPRILRAWQEWAQRKGIPFETILNVLHGRRSIDTIRLIAPWLPVEEEVAALEADEISDMQDVRLYPGAAELMEKLRHSPHAIVTSGSRLAAEARLKYVGLPIPAGLISGDEIQAGKPAPDGYILAARRLGMDPGDCVVIEDSPVGVEAGKAASMRVIAVASTHAAEALERADAVVHELTDIDFHAGGDSIEIQLRQ